MYINRPRPGAVATARSHALGHDPIYLSTALHTKDAIDGNNTRSPPGAGGISPKWRAARELLPAWDE
jgi:hypothetical protein